MQEQELFQNYELKGWEPSPRIYKIFGASALASLLSLFVVGQTQLLTTKGCDSPFVGKVCSVLDTLYVGGTALSTDAGMVSKEYEPNELADADITFINVDEQFKYPEGYFALSNPELANPALNPNDPMAIPGGNYIPDATGTFPGIPNPTIGGSNDLLSKVPELPKENPNAVIGNLPSSPYSVGSNRTLPKYKAPRNRPIKKAPALNNTSPDALPKLDTEQTADKNPTVDPKETADQTPLKNEPVKDFEINKKPLKDYAANLKAKYDKKEVDLTQPFNVVAVGVIDKDGKLDTKTIDPKTKRPVSGFVKAEGNEQMVEVAKQAIEAVGNSGWLGYLHMLGVDKINFTVIQDNENLKVVITSDQPTPQRAETIKNGLNGFIEGALMFDRSNIKKLGDDERLLLQSAKVTFSGKQFVLDFAMPKQKAQEMITRKLNEPPTPEEKKPNSAAQASENNKTAVK
jgi:hypothetical protein